jgi:Pregnancy-associated plasma protein-A
MTRFRTSAAAALGAAALSVTVTAVPAHAVHVRYDSGGRSCFDPHSVGAGARSGDTVRGPDTRDVTVREQRAIERRTRHLLASKGYSTDATANATAGTVDVPVYIHVMMDKAGKGNVTDNQITTQIAELNQDYAGQEASDAATTNFTFHLAKTDRYYNSTWHRDGSSTTYRAKTRLGGANALNIWLVDFKYLGIATFPWDYAANPSIDGIRVEYTSLPGGSAANYDQGKTATHESGHWLGLYHTFQGGCTDPNDQVADTPAQSGSTAGCPSGRDSCPLPGLDPIHNYMDYSYDRCYNQFTPDQSSRMARMWTAYRG